MPFALVLAAGCSDCAPPAEEVTPMPRSEQGPGSAPEPGDEAPAAPPAEPEGPVFGEPGETLEVELDVDAVARVDAVIESLRHSPYEIRARIAAKQHDGGAFVAVLHTYDQGAEWLGRRRTEGGWDRVERRMAAAKRECEEEIAEARSSGVPLDEYFEDEGGASGL